MKKRLTLSLVMSLLLMTVMFPEESLFLGEGRKDLSVEVDVPKLSGKLSDESTWVPEFVVNMLSDDMAKYSAITIVDTYNQDRIIEAQARDTEGAANVDEMVEIGNFTVAKNVLLVNITGKPAGYSLSLKINDKEKNTALAAFNEPNCSIDDLESGIVLKRAVADLLGQLGVKLTETAKKALLEVSNAGAVSGIQAQKDIARGTVAMQKGSSIEALSYFVKAKSSDNSLARASKLMSRAGTVVATTDFASSARNKIKMRNEFMTLISDTTDYFKKNFPYMVVYDPNLTEGKMNYAENTFNMDFKFSIILNHEAKELCQNINDAYLTMPDHENWGLESAMDSMIPLGTLLVQFDLKDADKKLIGTSEAYIFPLTGFRASGKRYYGGGSTSEVYGGKINVSADADTTAIVFGIADTKYTPETNRYTVKDHPEYFQKIELSKLTVKDYVNKVLMPAFEETELMPGVILMTVSRGIEVETYDRMLSTYGYPVLKEIGKQIAGKPSVPIKSVIYNADEGKIIEGLSRASEIAKLEKVMGRNIVTERDQVYIKDAKAPFPRNREVFAADYVKYLPLEFVRIKESDKLLFLKNTENLIALMFLGTNGKLRFSDATYRYGSFSGNMQSVGALYPRDEKWNEDFVQKLKVLYPSVKVAMKNNEYYSNIVKDYLYDSDETTKVFVQHYINRNSSLKYVSLRGFTDCYFYSDSDVLPISISFKDVVQGPIRKHLNKNTIKKIDCYEITENLYNTVVSLAKKYGVQNTLKEVYDKGSAAGWNEEFISVLNQLWGENSRGSTAFFSIDAKTGKKLAKDPAGAQIVNNVSSYFYGKF